MSDSNPMIDELYDAIDNHQRPFEITNQEMAIWALRKINLIEKRRREAKETAMSEAQRIMTWYEDLNTKSDRDREYFDGLLLGYMNRLRLEDPSLKTVKLPGGKLKMRKQQPEFTYDDDQLIAWARVHYPEYIQIKESVYKPDIKTYIKETGEVVPGVNISYRPDQFIVEVE